MTVRYRLNILTIRDQILVLVLIVLPASLILPFRLTLILEYLLIVLWLTAHIWKSKKVSFQIDRMVLSFLAFYSII